MSLLFQVSADIVWPKSADPCRVDTHRTPDLAKLGTPKVVCTNICTHCGIRSCLGTRECLISHRRLSGRSTPTPFLPPSAEMVWVLSLAVLLCWQRQSFHYYFQSLCAVHLPSFNRKCRVDWWCCVRRQLCAVNKINREGENRWGNGVERVKRKSVKIPAPTCFRNLYK